MHDLAYYDKRMNAHAHVVMHSSVVVDDGARHLALLNAVISESDHDQHFSCSGERHGMQSWLTGKII
jgi:hypothetical protein